VQKKLPALVYLTREIFKESLPRLFQLLTGVLLNGMAVDRVEVKITHFNNKKFSGYVSMKDAKHAVFEAPGVLAQVNYHETTFGREKVEDDLCISFRLRQGMEKESPY
jgi:hypothetical protein